MTQLEKILFTAKVHTTGGRSGESISSDGHLNVKLSVPGTAGTGTNPEQMFAAGWSACFIGAMEIAAKALQIELPPGTADDVEVDLCFSNGGYFLKARHTITLPGLERKVAIALIDTAHQTCPYSKAIRGNIDVSFTLASPGGRPNVPDQIYRARSSGE